MPPAATFPASGLLDGLTAAQHLAVTTEASPLCVLAAAGAGKTRVLTRRIAYRAEAGSAEARHVLALTFTRKAATELSDRLSALGVRELVTAGTFHAVAAAQLRRWWSDRGRAPLTLLDRKGRVLAPLAAARPALAGVPLAEVAGHLEWAKARLVAPEDFALAATDAGRLSTAPLEEVAALYQRYEHEKARRGLLDFDDLLGRAAEAIEQDAELAGALRWRWRHVFVDEFQDINPLQHRLLEAWLGTSRDLCVVGDPNQAIYGWNGSDPGLLGRFAERWPGAEVVRLDDNHRCTPQIVAAASAVLGGTPEGARLRSSRPDGEAPSVRSYPSEAAEAHGVAAEVRAAQRAGRRWGSMAVLVRTNAQVSAFREAFDAAGIPYQAPGATALLEQPAAREAVAALHGDARRPAQMVAADLAQAAGEAAEASDVAGAGALAGLASLAGAFARLEQGGNAAGFLAWLPTALDPEDLAPDADAVTVCSFHRAKGLEWKATWVCGLERGLAPIGYASTPAELDEERRLLYVALTRAEDELRCSWAEARSFGAKAVRREPSPWLEAVRLAHPAGTGGEPTGPAPAMTVKDWRTELRRQRASLHDRHRSWRPRRPQERSGSDMAAAPWPDPDPAVTSRLDDWRRSVARASGVPARVLLHDSTLLALAALRPATEAELLAVPGLGPVKAARYGAALLGLVHDEPATA